MKVTFIGHGYVGLVTAAAFAELGSMVSVVGRTKEKIEALKKGDTLIYEPGLLEVVKRNIAAKRLLFTLDYTEAIPNADIVFIAVGTPPKENGEADLSSVFAVSELIGKHLNGYTVIVTKSTVPPGTNRKVGEIVEKTKPAKATFDIASSPEFLREGTALADTLHPDRIVIGVESEKAKKLLLEVHEPISGKRVVTNIESAEMIKYASNAFLSTKISFANAIAIISEHVGADVERVLDGVGLDRRIGRNFLYPGVGYGGSCFPKDVKALIALSVAVGYDFDLLKAVDEINNQASQFFIKKITSHFGSDIKGKKVAVLGLSFKPDTDDMREAPSVKIINVLHKEGLHIRAYDPIATENAKKILPFVHCATDAYDAVSGCDAVIVVTEWNEFRQIDLSKLKNLMNDPVLFDGRNIYDPDRAEKAGFTYYGVGRGKHL